MVLDIFLESILCSLDFFVWPWPVHMVFIFDSGKFAPASVAAKPALGNANAAKTKSAEKPKASAEAAKGKGKDSDSDEDSDEDDDEDDDFDNEVILSHYVLSPYENISFFFFFHYIVL